MAGPSKRAISHLLSKTEDDPYAVFGKPTVAETSDFCKVFFEQCDTMSVHLPNRALERSFIARELARRTKDRHVEVAALGLVGTGYRLEAKYDKGLSAYQEAQDLARGCTCCLPDIYRRRGMLVFYLEDFDRSISCFDEAIALFEQEGNSDGIGRILITRCLPLKEVDRLEEALENNSRGLHLLAPTTPTIYHIAGLVNLISITAAMVQRSNDKSGIAEALETVVTFRRNLASQKQKHGFQRVRAIMRWCEGQLLGSLDGHENRSRGIDALMAARNSFERLGAVSDQLLVTADLLRLYLSNTRIDNSRRASTLASACLKDLPPQAEEAILFRRLEREPTLDVAEALRESLARSRRDVINTRMPCISTEVVNQAVVATAG